MSTATWTNIYNMTTDAGFRVIGLAASTNLSAVNATILAKTADTGQINWVTVTKPVAINTSAGYEIYKFTQAVGNLFYKIEYGTGGTATATFATWVTIGTGSDGAGNITGVTAARTQGTGTSFVGTTNSYPSYSCCLNGAFWILAGAGSNASVTGGTAQTFFGHAFTCDSTGTVTTDGYETFLVNMSASTATTNAVNPATVNVFTSATGQNVLVPYGITASNYGTGGNNIFQVWRHEIPLPQTLTTAFVGTYITSEAGVASTTTMAIVASTTHTFFFTGAAVLHGANSNNDSWVLIYE